MAAEPVSAADRAIARTLDTLLVPGTVAELRIPATRRGTISGYYDDRDRLAADAARWNGQANVYVTLNPTAPALLARSANRLSEYSKHTTSDADILARTRLPIDFDPVRPAGISATDEEHAAALARARECADWLARQGWPAPIIADSGNGGHLVYAVDLPRDDAGLVQRVLAALAFRFDGAGVTVDQTTYNPARIWKLYGTKACKGDDTPARPHRLARLLDVPRVLPPVGRDLLEALAASVPQPPIGRPINGGAFDLDRWIAASGLDVARDGAWSGGRKWVLNVCPWNSGHTDRSAYIVQFANGAIAAGCHHNGCAGKKWHDLRDVVAPAWREGRGDDGAMFQVDSHTPQGEGSSEPTPSVPWERPVPLDAPALPVFPLDTLPPVLGTFVGALATATQTPPDLAGLQALAAVATAVARKARVLVRPGWEEPLNIYTAGVLPSGNRKTAVVRAVVAPLEAWERAELARTAPEIEVARSRRRTKEAALRKAEKEAAEGKDAPERAAAAERAEGHARDLAAMPEPAAPQLIADDATPETVKTLLYEQGGRLALLSAEGTVFELMAGRYSKNGGPNLEVYLQGHAGDTIRVNRRGRSELVHDPALTIGVAVQPDVLRAFADHPAFRGRGLTARFFYALPESFVGRRQTEPPPVPDDVRDDYTAMLTALLNLPLPARPCHLVLDAHAAERFRAFARATEPQLAEFGRLGDLADWGGKLAGGVARLAGLLHLAAHADRPAPWDEPIGLATIEAAIRLGEYLIPHALAAGAAMGLDPAIDDARYLLRWLTGPTEAELPEQVIWQGTKRRFERVERLRTALALLGEHGYVRPLPTPRQATGKPPRPTYALSPFLRPNSPNTPNTAEQDADEGASRGIRGIRTELDTTDEGDDWGEL